MGFTTKCPAYRRWLWPIDASVPESSIGLTLMGLLFFIGALMAWLGKVALKQMR